MRKTRILSGNVANWLSSAQPDGQGNGDTVSTTRITETPSAARPVAWKSYGDTALAGLLVFLFHLWNMPAAAAGEIFRRSNLAFDFDINRFVFLWCTSPFPVDENRDFYAVRHPLAVIVRVACTPLVATGLEPRLAACGIAAFFAALAAMLVYRTALVLGAERPLAGLLTVLWAVSTTPLLLGVLPETYGLALVALGAQFLLAIRWSEGREPRLAPRAAAAVANFGITITNALLSGLTELMCRLRREPPHNALKGTIGFGAIAGSLALALSIASFSIWPVERVDSPVAALKEVYWSATSAERVAVRQPPHEVAWTFAVSSFVAPAPARYPSGLEGNPYLWDFRGYGYALTGWAAVLGWLGLLLFGMSVAATERKRWPVFALAGVWLAFNIGLHSYWQFRESVFLYAAHSQMAVFLFVLAGATAAQRWRPHGRLAYGAAAALVTALIAMNNLPIYFRLGQLD